MEPVTAMIAVAQVGAAIAGMFSSGSSGPDPSKVAIMETYKAVLVINDRLGAMEDGISGVHSAVIALNQGMDEAFALQNDQEQVEALLGRLRNFELSYESYLAAIRDDSVEPSQPIDIYKSDLSSNRNDFRQEVIEVSTGAPFSLDVALVAASIEYYIGQRFPGQINSPETWAQGRINDIVDTANGELTAKIAGALAKVEEDREDAEKILAISGEEWTAKPKAIVYTGSYYDRWNAYASILCMPFDLVKVTEDQANPFLQPQSQEPYSVIVDAKGNELNTDVCGSPVEIKDKKLFVGDIELERVDGPDFRAKMSKGEKKSLGFCLGTGSQGANCIQKKFEIVRNRVNGQRQLLQNLQLVIPDRYAEALAALEQVNRSTARYELLVRYKKDVLRAAKLFEALLEATEPESNTVGPDPVFAEQLEQVANYGRADIYGTLRDFRHADLDEQKNQFLNELTEAAQSADLEIAAGIERYKGAIKAYEDRGINDVAKVLKGITLALQFIKVVDGLSKVTWTDNTPYAPQSTEKTTAADGAADGANVVEKTTVTAANVGEPPSLRWDRVRANLDRLKELKLPVGQPDQRLTEQEEIAAELTKDLVNWGPTEADELYDKYQATRENAGQDAWNAVLDVRPVDAAKVILRETLTPTMTAPATLDSVRERDAFWEEARPWLESLRLWRTGVAQ